MVGRSGSELQLQRQPHRRPPNRGWTCSAGAGRMARGPAGPGSARPPPVRAKPGNRPALSLCNFGGAISTPYGLSVNLHPAPVGSLADSCPPEEGRMPTRATKLKVTYPCSRPILEVRWLRTVQEQLLGVIVCMIGGGAALFGIRGRPAGSIPGRVSTCSPNCPSGCGASWSRALVRSCSCSGFSLLSAPLSELGMTGPSARWQVGRRLVSGMVERW